MANVSVVESLQLLLMCHEDSHAWERDILS